jgi:hypothetical protein
MQPLDAHQKFLLAAMWLKKNESLCEQGFAD